MTRTLNEMYIPQCNSMVQSKLAPSPVNWPVQRDTVFLIPLLTNELTGLRRSARGTDKASNEINAQNYWISDFVHCPEF